MRQLTDHQKRFIAKTYFKTEKYGGWFNIAYQLLTDGQCVVAGRECIWRGGIGNFIVCEEKDEYVDCLIYHFDLEAFLGSAWYKDEYQHHLNAYEDRVKDAEQELYLAKQIFHDIYELIPTLEG